MERIGIITYGQFAWYEPLLILLMDNLMEIFYGGCGLMKWMKWILKWWLYDVEEKRWKWAMAIICIRKYASE